MSKYLGIIGYPIKHTLSPAMHNAALQAQNLPYTYLPFQVEPANLEDALKGFKAINCVGLNVTIPHKVAVIPYLDELTPAAALIGAVNTLVLRDGNWIGDNTDGSGFLRSLQETGVDPKGALVFILGAGGAARAVAVQLGLAGAKEIVIANRTQEKAAILAEELKAKISNVNYRFTGFERHELAGEIAKASVVINATPIGMESYGEQEFPIEKDWLKSSQLVADLVYRPLLTPFLALALRAGARILTGEKMLLYQGVEAYRLWTGIEPPVQVMRDALLAGLSKTTW